VTASIERLRWVSILAAIAGFILGWFGGDVGRRHQPAH
jgi:hypothetical protein